MYRWSTQRKVFGKPLHSQAVIRAKIAGMISRAESEYPACYPGLFSTESQAFKIGLRISHTRCVTW